MLKVFDTGFAEDTVHAEITLQSGAGTAETKVSDGPRVRSTPKMSAQYGDIIGENLKYLTPRQPTAKAGLQTTTTTISQVAGRVIQYVVWYDTPLPAIQCRGSNVPLSPRR